MGADDLDEGWFAKYGDVVVLVARVIPLARSIVSIPAGTSRMRPVRFAVFTAEGSTIWNAAPIGAGNALGANWDRVSGWVGQYSDAVLVILAAGVALFPGVRRFRRVRSGGDDEPRAGDAR